MGIEPLMVIGAFGGGILGAAMGALPAITLWGAVLMVAGLAGVITGEPVRVWDIAFNPLFGAHIVYAGGAAALAYAWSRKAIDSGLNFLQPLAGLGRADILLVGGVFGAIGMVLERVGTALSLPTDTVALSVVLTGWLARVLFDPKWRANRGKGEEGETWWPNGKELGLLVALGCGVGLAGGIAAVKIGDPLLPFGLALLFLAYLQMGFSGQPWHHIVLVAGLAALQGGGTVNAMVWATVLGGATAIVSYLFSKWWIVRTNSYIDPPVTSIAVGKTIVIALAAAGLL